jgi:hypothetical protein
MGKLMDRCGDQLDPQPPPDPLLSPGHNRDRLIRQIGPATTSETPSLVIPQQHVPPSPPAPTRNPTHASPDPRLASRDSPRPGNQNLISTSSSRFAASHGTILTQAAIHPVQSHIPFQNCA